MNGKQKHQKKVIKMELQMLFDGLKLLQYMKKAAIKAGTKILKSNMCAVAKYLVDGIC